MTGLLVLDGVAERRLRGSGAVDTHAHVRAAMLSLPYATSAAIPRTLC